MIMSNFQNSLADNLASLNDSFSQMSTQRKFAQASDDPIDAMKTLQSLHGLNDIQQNSANVQNAQSWVQNTESTVDTVNSIIKSAQEILTKANNSATTNSDDRATYAKNLDELQSELMQTLNGTFNGRYVFGGTSNGPAPFKVGNKAEDGAANDGKLMAYDYTNSKYVSFASITTSTKSNFELTSPVDVGLGMKLDPNGRVVAGTAFDSATSGVDMLSFNMTSTGGNDIYDVLSSAVSKLSTEKAPDLSGEISGAGDALDSALRTDVTLGSKSNFLNFLDDKNTSQSTNLTDKLSSLEDVNLAKAISTYEQKDAVYNASLSVGTKIVSLSVVDFLK